MLNHTACARFPGLSAKPPRFAARSLDRRCGRLSFLAVAILGLTGAASCGGGSVDVSVTRGALSYHLGVTDCAVHFTGVKDQAPVSVDLNCPVDLQPSTVVPALLLSVPLTTAIANPISLTDAQYGTPDYIPNHFLLVTYRDSGRTITCDPQKAAGSVSYQAIPQVQNTKKQRLAGSFSADAALLNCHSDTGPEPGGPLKLSGSFDILVP